MNRCPFCAEEIQDQAIKCRFCGEWLDSNSKAAGPDAINIADPYPLNQKMPGSVENDLVSSTNDLSSKDKSQSKTDHKRGLSFLKLAMFYIALALITFLLRAVIGKLNGDLLTVVLPQVFGAALPPFLFGAWAGNLLGQKERYVVAIVISLILLAAEMSVSLRD